MIVNDEIGLHCRKGFIDFSIISPDIDREVEIFLTRREGKKGKISIWLKDNEVIEIASHLCKVVRALKNKAITCKDSLELSLSGIMGRIELKGKRNLALSEGECNLIMLALLIAKDELDEDMESDGANDISTENIEKLYNIILSGERDILQ